MLKCSRLLLFLTTAQYLPCMDVMLSLSAKLVNCILWILATFTVKQSAS